MVSTLVEEDFFKRLLRFDADHEEDFKLWALRFEVLAEAKECAEVLFSDSIEGKDVSSLPIDLKKKLSRVRAILVMFL